MSGWLGRFEMEVNRVGVSHIAQALGIARNTVYNWMANGNAPLNQLLALEGLGVDIMYVLTGIPKRAGEPLKAEQSVVRYGEGLDANEVDLIRVYRQSTPEIQAAALRLLAPDWKPGKSKRVPVPQRVELRSSELPDRSFTVPVVRAPRKKKDDAA